MKKHAQRWVLIAAVIENREVRQVKGNISFPLEHLDLAPLLSRVMKLVTLLVGY